MNSIVEKINSCGWTDWSVDKLEMDFDKVLVRVSENIEGTVTICCKDYIGISYIGHWDESVIEDIRIETNGSLINESLENVKKLYGENPLLGGGVKEISDNWYQLNIKLIDGNIIKVVCKNIEIVEVK